MTIPRPRSKLPQGLNALPAPQRKAIFDPIQRELGKTEDIILIRPETTPDTFRHASPRAYSRPAGMTRTLVVPAAWDSLRRRLRALVLDSTPRRRA